MASEAIWQAATERREGSPEPMPAYEDVPFAPKPAEKPPADAWGKPEPRKGDPEPLGANWPFPSSAHSKANEVPADAWSKPPADAWK